MGSAAAAAPRLILASTSPRRADLLAAAGLAFEVLDPGLGDAAEAVLLAEARAAGLGAGEAVSRLAVAKLLAALRRVSPPAGVAVLAADTAVVLDGDLLGKAASRVDAAAMLGRLRGRSHEVVTGLAALDRRGRLRVAADTSLVRMRAFGDDTLETYLRQGVWQGKAGAYGVQDQAAQPLIEAVEGSRSNVKGLPLERVGALCGLSS